MLPVIIIIVIIFIAMGFLSQKRQTQNKREVSNSSREPSYEQEALPVQLGMREDALLLETEQRLEKAFAAYFGDRLKWRVLEKNPNMQAAEFDWKLLELKRYFLMTAVLNNVPMFSGEIDTLWHEMLLFTQPYQRFCESFCGMMIHHSPHTSPQPKPDEKAWFDWVYSHLFEQTPFSSRLWNGFFRFPLPMERLDQLERFSAPELLETLFNTQAAERFEEIKRAIYTFIDKAKEQMRNAASNSSNDAFAFHQVGGLLPNLAGAMIFYSMTNQDTYADAMNPIIDQNEEWIMESSSSCSSGTEGGGTISGESGNGTDGGSSGDGGNTGDSGGSSSSCGSSCGGGGGE